MLPEDVVARVPSPVPEGPGEAPDGRFDSKIERAGPVPAGAGSSITREALVSTLGHRYTNEAPGRGEVAAST
jgi:hypothetical protein